MSIRALSVAVCLVLTLSGCAHPAPRSIVLPTTAAVRAPIVAAAGNAAKAAASNARAVKLADQALKAGIHAGSQEAHALANATQETQNELAQVKVQLALATSAVDQLAGQLLTARHEIDALAKHDAAETVRADKAVQAKRSADHVAFVLFLVILAILAAVAFVGTQMEATIRVLVNVCVSAAAAAWHVALHFVLRFWPLVLAAF